MPPHIPLFYTISYRILQKTLHFLRTLCKFCSRSHLSQKEKRPASRTDRRYRPLSILNYAQSKTLRHKPNDNYSSLCNYSAQPVFSPLDCLEKVCRPSITRITARIAIAAAKHNWNQSPHRAVPAEIIPILPMIV